MRWRGVWPNAFPGPCNDESPRAVTPVVRILWEAWADHALALPSYETAGAAGADIRANLPADIRAAGFVLAPMQQGGGADRYPRRNPARV